MTMKGMGQLVRIYYEKNRSLGMKTLLRRKEGSGQEIQP